MGPICGGNRDIYGSAGIQGLCGWLLGRLPKQASSAQQVPNIRGSGSEGRSEFFLPPVHLAANFRASVIEDGRQRFFHELFPINHCRNRGRLRDAFSASGLLASSFQVMKRARQGGNTHRHANHGVSNDSENSTYRHCANCCQDLPFHSTSQSSWSTHAGLLCLVIITSSAASNNRRPMPSR